jgi:NADH:ubiquinone oxidoreductase subunit 5 (subunit L)/multisubunit Na+/H+ antiporter MnhA subunit
VIQWLYRYIFRGIGIVMIIGMITILFLAVMMIRQESQHSPAARPAHTSVPR